MQHTRERKGVSAEHARLMRRATRLALAVALTLAMVWAMASVIPLVVAKVMVCEMANFCDVLRF